MTLIEAAVWVFWGVVALAVVRMLVAARRSAGAAEAVQQLRADFDKQRAADRTEFEQLRLRERVESLEAGQLTLSNKVESAKVSPIRRRGWGQ